MPRPNSRVAGGEAEAVRDAAPSPPRPTARGRGRPKRDEAGQLDRALLEHALDHFLEKGFEGATLNAITASLGMSKRTIYVRYGDKMTLFKAALQRAVEDWLEPLAQLPSLESEDLEATLLDVGRLIVTTLMSPAGLRLIRITNAESYRMPEIGAELYQRGRQQIASYLADLFRRRIYTRAAPPPGDLQDLATAFLNLMSGPARLTAWGLDPEPTDVETFVRTRVQLFLHGALPA